jgi:hypothetical protein
MVDVQGQHPAGTRSQLVVGGDPPAAADLATVRSEQPGSLEAACAGTRKLSVVNSRPWSTAVRGQQPQVRATAMLAGLTSLLGSVRRPQAEDDVIGRDRDRLLEAAISPQDRDEINDLFGRAMAD